MKNKFSKFLIIKYSRSFFQIYKAIPILFDIERAIELSNKPTKVHGIFISDI